MNGDLISNGQLTGRGTVLLVNGSRTRRWRWSSRGCCGKIADTFCVAVNLFANVATSPLDVMRCRRESSGSTGSGSVNL